MGLDKSQFMVLRLDQLDSSKPMVFENGVQICMWIILEMK